MHLACIIIHQQNWGGAELSRHQPTFTAKCISGSISLLLSKDIHSRLPTLQTLKHDRKQNHFNNHKIHLDFSFSFNISLSCCLFKLLNLQNVPRRHIVFF